MGQKTHPFGFRLGITEAHRSRWYAPKALYGELLVEDFKIREYLDKRLNRRPPNAAVSDIHIERTREELKIIIKTARPGLVIGPKGAEVERMTEELQYMTGRKVAMSIRSSRPSRWPSSSSSVHRSAASSRCVPKPRCPPVPRVARSRSRVVWVVRKCPASLTSAWARSP